MTVDDRPQSETENDTTLEDLFDSIPGARGIRVWRRGRKWRVSIRTKWITVRASSATLTRAWAEALAMLLAAEHATYQ